MNSFKYFFAVCLLVFLLPGSVSAATCSAPARNLFLGMEGEDVQALQKFLNTIPSTRVSQSGFGSLGQETTFFGSKTKAAVVKFQELYAKEVLTPVGLTKGSGFVGAFSRAKLTALMCAGISASPATPATPTVSPATPATPSASSEDKPLTLMQPSEYIVTHLSSVSVMGFGFLSAGNTVHIGDDTAIPNVKPSAAGDLEVVIPATVPKGKHDLWVSNTNGESNKSFLIIVDGKTKAPKITSFTPKTGLTGTKITVTGEGFTATNNEIYVSDTVISGVASADTETLSFALNITVPGLSAGEDVESLDLNVPMWFYVVNANGVSNEGVFTLKI